jgi:dephospho-CoA kinase
VTAARTLRIGLTGPIGCGKSTVGRRLEEHGAVFVDADAVVREVTAPGTPAAGAILEAFGPAVAADGGGIDRAALAGIVFADAARLRELEAIIHPAVRPAILARIEAAESAGAPVVAVEAIRLVEGGLAQLCDEVWLVTCEPATQFARTVHRSGDEADARRRIDAQRGLTERLRPHAHRVLDTSGDPDATRAAADGALAAALAAVSRSA